MNRQATLLAVLGLVLLVVLFYLFGWKPRSEELETVRIEIDDAVAQQAQLEAEIASLESVRATAPEIEAALAAAESLVPREAALPSALRQLQLAADDSGVALLSISPGRPVADEIVPEVARIALSLSAEGSYFQMVDFLRRVEDPTITPRVILFENATVSITEYPTLSMALSGFMFAILPAPPAPEPTETATPAPTDGTTPVPTESPTPTAMEEAA